MVRHPHFTQPIFVSFPRPAVMRDVTASSAFRRRRTSRAMWACCARCGASIRRSRSAWVQDVIGLYEEDDVLRALHATLAHAPDNAAAYFKSQFREDSCALPRPRPRELRFACSPTMIRTRSEPAARRLARAIRRSCSRFSAAHPCAPRRDGDAAHPAARRGHDAHALRSVGRDGRHAQRPLRRHDDDVAHGIMILSHSLVQASDGHGTTVLAITDSVAMEGHGTGATRRPRRSQRAMQGRQARLHISHDGSAELLDASRRVSRREVEALYSGMPARCPSEARGRGLDLDRNAFIPVSQESGSAHSAKRAHDLPSRLALVERQPRVHLDPRDDLARQRGSARLGVAARGIDWDGHRAHDDGPEARVDGWSPRSRSRSRACVTRIVQPVSTDAGADARCAAVACKPGSAP